MSLPVLKIWNKLAGLPAGQWMFSRILCTKAPYFSSIRPRITKLDQQTCEVRIGKRRAVLNHIGTIHAIAMCNMAELAGGLLTDANLPPTHRWIPKGMSVEYLARAETDLVARASFSTPPSFGPAAELPVTVEVFDTRQQLVFRARIAMWVSPKNG